MISINCVPVSNYSIYSDNWQRKPGKITIYSRIRNFRTSPKQCFKNVKGMFSTSLALWKPHTSEEWFKIGATNESKMLILSVVSKATVSNRQWKEWFKGLGS